MYFICANRLQFWEWMLPCDRALHFAFRFRASFLAFFENPVPHHHEFLGGVVCMGGSVSGLV